VFRCISQGGHSSAPQRVRCKSAGAKGGAPSSQAGTPPGRLLQESYEGDFTESPTQCETATAFAPTSFPTRLMTQCLGRACTRLISTRRSWRASRHFHRRTWVELLVPQPRPANSMPHAGRLPILIRSTKQTTQPAQARAAIATSRRDYMDLLLRMATAHTSKNTAEARRITIGTVPRLLRFNRQNAADRHANMSRKSAAYGTTAGSRRACQDSLPSITTATTTITTIHKRRAW
jgi:hypothetical protein